MNNESIPTGEVASVLGTPFDFTAPRSIGSRIAQVHSFRHTCSAGARSPYKPWNS